MMKKNVFRIRGVVEGCLSISFILLFSETVFAAHPLITDDSGTVGKGKIQVELNAMFDFEKSGDIEKKVRK